MNKKVKQAVLAGRQVILLPSGKMWRAFPVPWFTGDKKWEVVSPSGKEFSLIQGQDGLVTCWKI